jgi:heterodisulfide reductase subunit A
MCIRDSSGSLGNFNVGVNIVKGSNHPEKLVLNVGSVLVATGMEPYQPKPEEFGYGIFKNVVTLSEFDELIQQNTDRLIVNNVPVRKVAFVYCVGNRQKKGENKYCSRFCCTAAINTAINIKEQYKDITSFHLFRDIRTYGKQEILYEKSSKQGDVYVRFDEKDPPVVEMQNDCLTVKVKDYLTSKQELEIGVDLVVLVTGAVARSNSKEISDVFKIPVGGDRFFNEIHPKLKPVETVIKGVYIGGCCQGPKNISESVQSTMSAASKINALLQGGTVSLDPVVARIDSEVCVWCGKCAEACDYDAIKEVDFKDKKVAVVNNATCAGCGICAPVCPLDAIELAQYTNKEIEGMIDGFMQQVVMKETAAVEETVDEGPRVTMKEYPQLWKNIVAELAKEPQTIPQLTKALQSGSEEITWHLMTMNKYGVVMADGLDDSETYFKYKLKN